MFHSSSLDSVAAFFSRVRGATHSLTLRQWIGFQLLVRGVKRFTVLTDPVSALSESEDRLHKLRSELTDDQIHFVQERTFCPWHKLTRKQFRRVVVKDVARDSATGKTTRTTHVYVKTDLVNWSHRVAGKVALPT